MPNETPKTPEQETPPQATTTPLKSVDEMLLSHKPATPVVAAQDASLEADEKAKTSTDPTTDDETAKAVEEKVEESLGKKLSKKDKETIRLRKRAQESEAETARIKAYYAERGDPYPGADEPSPEEVEAARVRLVTRQEDGRARFIEENGAEAWKDTFEKEDGPWQTFKLTVTDEEAALYDGRIKRARDPVKEALVILKEHELFEKHGTRNLAELVQLEVAAQTETIKKSVLDELKAGGTTKPGKAVATLREATSVEESVKADGRPIKSVDQMLSWAK